MSFGLMNAPAHFTDLMNTIFMPELDKLSWCSLTTYLYIQRVRKIMKTICESCFNDSGTISSMQNAASVNSRLVE
jgi:hypothetical protein